jgi:hypothetical protein
MTNSDCDSTWFRPECVFLLSLEVDIESLLLEANYSDHMALRLKSSELAPYLCLCLGAQMCFESG